MTNNETIKKLKLKIAERNRIAEAFKLLVESTVETIGQDFFNNITSVLCESFSADGAIVAEIVDNVSARALSMKLDGRKVPDYSYKLE